MKIIINNQQLKGLKYFIAENYYQTPIKETPLDYSFDDEIKVRDNLKQAEDELNRLKVNYGKVKASGAKKNAGYVKNLPDRMKKQEEYIVFVKKFISELDKLKKVPNSEKIEVSFGRTGETPKTLKGNELEVLKMYYSGGNQNLKNLIGGLLSTDSNSDNLVYNNDNNKSSIHNLDNEKIFYNKPGLGFGNAVGIKAGEEIMAKYGIHSGREKMTVQIIKFEPNSGYENIQFDETKKLKGVIQKINHNNNEVVLFTFKYNNKLYGVEIKEDYNKYEDIKGQLFKLDTKNEKINYSNPESIGKVTLSSKGTF